MILKLKYIIITHTTERSFASQIIKFDYNTYWEKQIQPTYYYSWLVS